MSPVTVSVVVEAPLQAVWNTLADLESHAGWMADAASIEFPAGRRSGPGTVMLVDTRVGPFRLLDRLTVTEWVEPRTIAVTHQGLVRGWGRFDLSPRADGIRVTWSERLRFPWWLGGALTSLASRPVLRLVWAANLRRFRRTVLSAR